MKYEILPMQARHGPQIAALERLCFSDPWNEAAVGGELENPLSLWLVAEQNGAVLGYVGSQMVPPEADMMNIAVALPFRKWRDEPVPGGASFQRGCAEPL